MRTLSKLFLVGLMIIALGTSTAAAEDSENRTPAGKPEKRHNVSLFGGGHHTIEEGSEKGGIVGAQKEAP